MTYQTLHYLLPFFPISFPTAPYLTVLTQAIINYLQFSHHIMLSRHQNFVDPRLFA